MLGYMILTPFVILSTFKAFSDAHMLLLYNSEFVEVLNVMTFDRDVLGVIKRKPEVLKTEVLGPTTSQKQRWSQSVLSRSFRVSQSASTGMEPEPEPEAYQSRSASPVRPGVGSINVSRAASPQRRR
jgi:hypothetical protein